MAQSRYDEVISIPEVTRPDGSRVFQADNTDSDWKNGLIVLVVFALASVCFYFATGSMRGSVILYLILAAVTMLVITGTLTTVIAIFGETLTEWNWSRVEMERVKGAKAVILARLTNEREGQQQQHELEMTRLSKDKTLHALQEDVAYLLTQTNKTSEHNYVNNKPLVMQNNVQVWLRSQYGQDGLGEAGSSTTGKLPWNAEWSGQPWKELAKDMLTKGDDSPLVTVRNDKTGKPSHYLLRYGSATEALRSVGFS